VFARPSRWLLLVATPLAFAVALWWHPPGGEDVYEGVRDDVGAWMFVHTTFLFATPLLAIAAYLLLRGLDSPAATNRVRGDSRGRDTPQILPAGS
jgi:hypothetical protein